MSPHLKRWITALIAGPILITVIVYGGMDSFAVLIAVVSLAGMYEYNRMAFGSDFCPNKVMTLVSAAMILLTAAAGETAMLFPLVTFSVMAVLMLSLVRSPKSGIDMAAAGRTLFGIMYIPVLMSHFILIRRTEYGVIWVFFILVLAFAGDVAAYYVGRKFGKRKLLPEVSPGKSVEGTIALVAGSVIGCIVYQQLFFPMLTVTHSVILGLVGSITGQLGDLSESALKRVAGVKDSGFLLPGHGGILDRLDCLMFIAPFVYYYQEYVIR